MSATNVAQLPRTALPPHCSKATRALDTIHFRSPVAAIGTFACPVGHVSFRDSGAIERAIVVFPRTSVWIQHEGSRRFVADPSVATIYNRSQRYERTPIAADGDISDWFSVEDDVAREMVASFSPAHADDARGPFRFQSAPTRAALYLQQRVTLRHAIARHADALTLEEMVLDIVTRVLALAYTQTEQSKPKHAATWHRHRALVEATKEEILRRIDENVSVREIAATVGATPFHLCRVFRQATQQTINAYRADVRLRLLLESLGDAPKASLSALAVSLGFASHAHLVKHCRERWGATPREIRELVRTYQR